MSRLSIASLITYTPKAHNADQAALHHADDIDQALYKASCLLGWYRRPVAIDMQITADNDERYMLRPHEVAPLAGWEPVYELKRLGL